MNKELVARNLLHQRTLRGLTQEQLAERAGITARTIQRIEAATGAPHLTTLALLAGALAIPVQALSQEPTAALPVVEPGRASPIMTSNQLALLHLVPLLGIVVPFANILAPVFFWLSRRATDARFDAQGRAVINFQLSMTLGIGLGVGCLVLYFPVGAVLLALCYGLVVAMSVVNAQRALRNHRVYYPLSLPIFSSASTAKDA
ncbi:hypothetical protein GCM10022409_23950 [Hymenobacter glaciei]|uniref:HTH cro/C1-type domain-containing protein n=1 Tax=Hymenobacter glaciei TaxID=877209 RepID=A0ABP7U8Q6_9BACT